MIKLVLKSFMTGLLVMILGVALTSQLLSINLVSALVMVVLAMIVLLLALVFLVKRSVYPLQKGVDLLVQRCLSNEEESQYHSLAITQHYEDNPHIKVMLSEIDRLLNDFVKSSMALSSSSSENAISAAEVSFATSQLREKIERQASQIGSVLKVSEEVSDFGLSISISSKQSQDSSQKAKQKTEQCLALLTVAVEKIGLIFEYTEKAYQQIDSLNDNSNKIKEVTQVIEGIADQTNLLALNAAIEAARAGEMGRGFAVVADEVRGLAARTAEATSEVGLIIEVNHKETHEVVTLFERLSTEVKSGTEQINRISSILSEVTAATSEVAGSIAHVSTMADSNQQSLMMIKDNVSDINDELLISRDHVQHLDEQAEK